MLRDASQDFDVAIVGLGPTGLTLAHFLGRRGLKVIVLEREPEFYGNARAVYTDDECMRIFQEAGVAAERAWIEQRYPDFIKKEHGLSSIGRKSYDEIHIETRDGRAIIIYFDITDFYGKW